MTRRFKLLVTGFGLFPGAPYNPTPALVQRLARLKRPAFSDVALLPHIFPVTYAAVDAQLPSLIAKHKPDGILMFGLAARTPYLRIETRARNAITRLWPDASQIIRQHGRIGEGPAASRLPQTNRWLRAARATGIDARLSRDAGRYLCNYIAFRAMAACAEGDGPKLAAFVHVPLTAHDGRAYRGRAGGITCDQLVDAGEAILFEMIAALRRINRRHELHA